MEPRLAEPTPAGPPHPPAAAARPLTPPPDAGSVPATTPGKPAGSNGATAPPAQTWTPLDAAVTVHGPPPPLRRGPLELWRFMRAHRMLTPRYAALLGRLALAKLRLGDRLQLDGIAFICPGVRLEVAPGARLVLGRWSWLGDDCKVRVHEGTVEIGAKSVLGQECTLTCFRQIRIGRDCVIADRVMMLDFDHGVVDAERPIREQGIYKRPVEVGHNCWIGYGVSILRGVRVGENCVIGTSSVVTRDIPANAVVGGAPAKVLRMRPAPRSMRYE